MRKLIPSRLVVVRSYGSAAAVRGGSWVFGSDDRKLLLDAGIEAHVKSVRAFGLALMVPESRAAEARQLLEASPNLFPAETVPLCPKCRAPHPSQRPPYAGAVLGLGFLAIVVAIVADYIGTAEIVAVVTVVVSTIIQIMVPQWRCQACGRLFGTISDPDGRFGNVRDFKTRL